MKVTSRQGVKIIKLTNMEDLVGEVFSGEDPSGQQCILIKDAFLVSILNGADPSNSLMNVTPFSPLSDDDFIPIYYDSIVTMFNAKKSFVEYYNGIRKKWKNLPEPVDEFKTTSEHLDDIEEPSDEQLDILEAMLRMNKGDGTIH
jgi:hypothetical protein